MTTSETAKRPPGLQYAKGFAQDGIFVGRKIDYAIRDDDIDGIVGQRECVRFRLSGIRRFRLRFLLVLVGEREHFIGHIEAVGFSGRTNALRGEQHVDSAA